MVSLGEQLVNVGCLMADLAERRKELLDSMMREAIYDGAVKVLTGHGIGGLTMDRVAAAAGVAKGSLYNHFRSKKDLLEFVHERAIAPMRAAADEIAVGPLSPSKKLKAVLSAWRTNLEQRRELFEFLINDSIAEGILKESAMTARESAIETIATIIRQGIERGEFCPMDADVLADIFLGATIGMCEREFATGVRRTVEEAVDALMRVFLFGVSTGRA